MILSRKEEDDRYMHILIIGAAGMIGRKLTAALLRDGLGGTMPAQLTLADVVAPTAPQTSLTCRLVAADLADPATSTDLVSGRPDADRPSRRHRLGRGRSRFRQGLPHQSRRHAAICFDAIRALSATAYQAAAWCSRPRSPSSARRFPLPRSRTSS
jgi:NAD(P)-dependent dehydrogenase (short-subunit alcohol dehydrogenase family)